MFLRRWYTVHVRVLVVNEYDFEAMVGSPTSRQVMRPIMPREGVTLTRIAVDSRVRFSCQGRFDLGLRCL
jgi:hypothetical protein